MYFSFDTFVWVHRCRAIMVIISAIMVAATIYDSFFRKKFMTKEIKKLEERIRADLKRRWIFPMEAPPEGEKADPVPSPDGDQFPLRRLSSLASVTSQSDLLDDVKKDLGTGEVIDLPKYTLCE